MSGFVATNVSEMENDLIPKTTETLLVSEADVDLSSTDTILKLIASGNFSEYEEDGDAIIERNEALVVWEIVTLVIILFLTVCGNVVVLFMLLVRRKKLTRMCYFILSLCISDLITAFFNVLPQLVWEITYRFHGGGLLCKVVKFGQLLGPYLNSYLLVMTAFDRYQVICYPLSTCYWTPKKSRNMIYLAFILALGSSSPQLFVFSYQRLADGSWDCWADFIPPWGMKAYVTWYALSVFIVPLFILIFVYSCICRTLYVNFRHKQIDDHSRQLSQVIRPRLLVRLRSQRHNNDSNISTCVHEPPLRRDFALSSSDLNCAILPSSRSSPNLANGLSRITREEDNQRHYYSMNPRSHSTRSISRAKIKTVKLTVTVILCYITCSAPFISGQLWRVWDPHAESSPFFSGATFTILSLLSSLNSVVNPWIFLGFNENLRSLCSCRWNMRWWRTWRHTTFRSSGSHKNTKHFTFSNSDMDAHPHLPLAQRPTNTSTSALTTASVTRLNTIV